MRPLVIATLALLSGGLPLPAQRPVDTLPPIAVSLTRTTAAPARLGLPLSSSSGAVARRGREFVGLAELLDFVPGVFATDRGDATVDQRITIRGSGARSNFGVRGVRILIDGVPATLPDGQSQLGPLIASTVSRIDVARGPLASLHGNGAAGVIAVTTAAPPDHGDELRLITSVAGSGYRAAAISAGHGNAERGVTVSGEWHRGGSGRQHADATSRRLNAAARWRTAARGTLTLRAALQHDPFNRAPGALTETEFSADPRAAAPRNVALAAGKAVSQWQVSGGWDGRVGAVDVTSRTWLLGRRLNNPIAAPPPGAPDQGTWINLDRRVYGARAAIHLESGQHLDLSAGLDWQLMRDDHRNRATQGAGPVGAPFVDQVETVSELGPFVQALWQPTNTVSLRGGVRHDRVAVHVADALTPLASGRRVMAASSFSGSLAWVRSGWTAWAGVGQSFETPTTTELANRPDGGTGLNPTLMPARMLSGELGLRRETASARLELVGWTAVTRDAILPAADIGGRSHYHNVDRTHARGIEATATVVPVAGAVLRATVTGIDSRFGSGVHAGDGTSLANRRIPGVPALAARIGVGWLGNGWQLDLSQEFRGSTLADDVGTRRAAGWGLGVTDMTLRWWIGPDVTLSLIGSNLTSRHLVSSVVVNAAGGRFIQPLAPRQMRLGAELRL